MNEFYEGITVEPRSTDWPTLKIHGPFSLFSLIFFDGNNRIIGPLISVKVGFYYIDRPIQPKLQAEFQNL